MNRINKKRMISIRNEMMIGRNFNIKHDDVPMRVDPSFRELVNNIMEDLRDSNPSKNYNHAKTTKFISDTYPIDMIKKNLRLKRLRDDDDLLSILDF